MNHSPCFEDKTFKKTDFTKTAFLIGEYEKCSFINCNFSSTDLSNIHFTDCRFKDCNFSVTRLYHTSFRDVKFIDCKLLGVSFDDCDDFLFSVGFENCLLNLSSFYKRKMKKTVFKNCSLRETDLAAADLSGSVFDNCDLQDALFDDTNLEKADFRTAYHYSIDPEANQIKKARFSCEGIAGLLGKYDIEIEK